LLHTRHYIRTNELKAMEDPVKILVIDDNIVFTTVLELLLKKDESIVYKAYNGEEGIEKALQVKPDLILLDIIMPIMDGFEVLKRLRENPAFSDTIIVMFSGVKTSTDDQAAGLESGADGYITRPVSNRELLARIRAYIRLKRTEKARDLNEQKMLHYNEELQRSNQTKNKLFSIIAHDLRSPFNAFTGLLDELDEDYSSFGEQEKKKIIKALRKSSHQLEDLIENLLEWSRLQQDKIVFLPSLVNLSEIVENTISMHQIQADAKQIRLISNISQEMNLYADPNMLKTIVRNLVSNAIKYTPEEGSVEISARLEANKDVVISLKDSGIGMDRETIRALFSETDAMSIIGTSGEHGSGLGLVLCKEFVEKHGGRIWVESEQGKGSEFFFTIPHKLSTLK
jgi:two-component system, sensor histidine kinase and response regulator